MALPSTGPISFGNNTGDTTTQSVNRELGRASPFQQNLSMGDTVLRTLFGVSSGAISLAQGYGKSNMFYCTLPSTSNVIAYNIATAQGWNTTSPITFTTSGNIWASSTGYYALQFSGSYPNGATLVNNHIISGAGGAGGNAHYASPWGTVTYGVQPPAYGGPAGPSGSQGLAGGPAIFVSTLSVILIKNNGTIQGGGGGGGGGYNGNAPFGGSGAGGGAGIVGGAGGTGQIYMYYPAVTGTEYNVGSPAGWQDSHNRAGAAGTTSAGGTGGPGGYDAGYGDNRWGNHGGNGGAPGQPGGGNVYGRVGTGGVGAAGTSINGLNRVTWLPVGTLLGPTVP